MSRHYLVLALLLVGCKGCEEDETLPTVVTPVGGAPVAIWVGSGSGPGVAEVPVLRVDEIGAPVGGDDVNLSSDGVLAAATATLDASGWGLAEVSSPSTGAFAVTGSDGAQSAEGWAFVTAAPDVTVGFPAWLGGESGGAVAGAGGGVVLTRGGEAWWFPPLGGAGVRVLELASDIVELLPVQIDSDGVADALLWSGDTVVILRGRAEGGVGYWAAFEAKTGTVGAALVQDVDDDALIDLVVVVNGEESSQIAWMPGDGLGGFTTTAVLETDYQVHGVTAEDFDKNGSAELSLLTEDGLLRRYDNTSDGWQAASQSDFTLGVGEGGRVLGGLDLTEDGWYDVAIAGPIIDSESHTASITSPGGTSITITYRLEESISGGTGLAIADADLDGDPDIFLATDGTLRRYAWSETSGTFAAISHTSMPDHARIDAVDLDADGLVDVVYPGAPTFALFSTSKEDDPETADDEAMAWTTRTPTAGVFGLDLATVPWSGDFNADGLVDLVAFVNAEGLELVAFYGDGEASGGSETFREGSNEQLGGGATPLALAVCGSDSWALTSEGGVTTLWHHTLDAFGTLALAGSLEVNATAVACGNFEAGVAAAVSGTGEVTYVAADGSTQSDSLGQDVVELAAGDLDGDGLDELHACTGACSIAVGDCSGDGLDDLLLNDGTSTTLSIAGVAHDLGFNGWVSLGDADGDGVLDANVQADGVAVAFRGLGGRPGVPMASYMLREVEAAPAWRGDLDGNGVPDLFYLGGDTDLSDEVDWTGTVLYAEAPDAAE